MNTLSDIKQSALSLFAALDNQYRKATPAFDEQTFEDVLNYIQPRLSGTTKNFPYEGRILFLNQEADALLERGKFSAYFNIVEFNEMLKTEIVISRTDVHHPNISYISDIDHLLHEYGHFQSLIDWCMKNHPKPGTILETKSGMRYAPCYDFDGYWINEARSIFNEEVMACRYAVETVEKLPITEQQKLALMQFVKDSSEHTLEVYAKNVERLIERENNNGKDIISTIIPIEQISEVHSELNLLESISKTG
jgi:hypothetical protein